MPKLLDHTTLNITLKEVAFKKEAALQADLERILKHNKVEPSNEQDSPNKLAIPYYTIDLTPEQIELVLDILFDLEASNVNEEGEATPTGSFYATLVDKWMALKYAS